MYTTTFDELAALALWGTTADHHAGAPPTDLGARAEQLMQAIQDTLPGADSLERARLRHRMGYLALLTGAARTKSIEAFTMSRDGAVKAGDRALEGLALCGLAVAFDHVGERHKSLASAEAAEHIAHELGDQHLLAAALGCRAHYLKETGENERARAVYREIKAIGEAIDDTRWVMAALIGLGRTLPMSEAPEAVASYEKALELATASGSPARVAIIYNNLADWALYRGEIDEAIALRQTCLDMAVHLGLRPIAGRAIVGLAKTHSFRGDLATAKVLLDRGFPAVVSAADIEGDLHCSLNLAYLHLQQGDIARATELYRHTLERALQAPDHACAVFAQRALELVAEGQIPLPGIMPAQPVTDELLTDLQLEAVAGGAGMRNLRDLKLTYPTADLAWHVGL